MIGCGSQVCNWAWTAGNISAGNTSQFFPQLRTALLQAAVGKLHLSCRCLPLQEAMLKRLTRHAWLGRRLHLQPARDADGRPDWSRYVSANLALDQLRRAMLPVMPRSALRLQEVEVPCSESVHQHMDECAHFWCLAAAKRHRSIHAWASDQRSLSIWAYCPQYTYLYMVSSAMCQHRKLAVASVCLLTFITTALLKSILAGGGR